MFKQSSQTFDKSLMKTLIDFSIFKANNIVFKIFEFFF